MSVDIKFGDRVRIVKRVEDCGYHWHEGSFHLLGWAAHMSNLIGKEGRVCVVEDHEKPAIAVCVTGECVWWFSAESLEKV